MTAYLSTQAPYLSFVTLMAIGCYLILTHGHLARAVIGLYLVQASAILFFIQLAWIDHGTAPILEKNIEHATVNPLPHAMMLTAIVVGVATLGVAISLLSRIYHETGDLQDATGENDQA